MVKNLSTGGYAAALLAIGEAVLAAVLVSGLLKPKRRVSGKRRKRRTKAEMAAARSANGATKPKRSRNHKAERVRRKAIQPVEAEEEE